MKHFTSVILFVLLAAACSNNDSVSLRVLLADLPKDASAVNVEITGVSVQVISGTVARWYDLETESGIYNLSELESSVSKAFANGNNIPGGKLNLIRFDMGENNSVVFGQDTMDLVISRGVKQGISIPVNQNLANDNSYTVRLSFDSHASLQQTGFDKYILRPEIRVMAWETD